MTALLPEHIGGYQHLENGVVELTDIWVCDGQPESFVSKMFAGLDVGHVERIYGHDLYRIYRKMPCPSNKDDKIDPYPVMGEEGLIHCLDSKPLRFDETKPSNPKDAIGSDKVPLHLWPTTATAMGSMALLDGMLKYGRSNFRHIGVRSSIYYDALNRHMNAWFEGEDNDPDSGLDHLAHAIACIAVIIDAKAAGKLNDDRMFPGGYRKLVDELTPHVKRLKAKHKNKSPHHYKINDSGLTSAKTE